MVDINKLPYRPCVGILLLNQTNKVWVGKRIPKWEKDFSAQLWQMPQGGIDEGEEPLDAAFRELKEETGVTSVELVADIPEWLTYDLPVEAVGVALKGLFRGQRQRWYAMRYLGDDTDINIDPQLGEKPEFSEWKWVDMQSLPDMVVPFKREIYTRVVENFGHLATT